MVREDGQQVLFGRTGLGKATAGSAAARYDLSKGGKDGMVLVVRRNQNGSYTVLRSSLYNKGPLATPLLRDILGQGVQCAVVDRGGADITKDTTQLLLHNTGALKQDTVDNASGRRKRVRKGDEFI